MNGAQIQSYINQNYPGLGQLTNEQIQTIQNNAGGGQPGMIDQAIKSSPQYQTYTQQQATNTYNQQQGSAISGLQTQQSNLAGQYGSLLNTVTQQYQPLENQATMMQNEQNASRGLVSNVGNGGTQMLSALNPIYSAQAANAQQIGQGSISDMNTLQQAIASAQQTGAAGAAALPLEYGSLSLAQQALPASIAANQAQANEYNAEAQSAPYVSTNIPGITFDAANNTASLFGQPVSLSNMSSSQIQQIIAQLSKSSST